MHTLSLVIPLYNEQKNIPALLTMIEASGLSAMGLKEVILVNNGSADNSAQVLDQLSLRYPWAKPIHLKENINYGGGVYFGIKQASSEYIGYLPGDLQVSADDVKKIWAEISVHPSKHILIKGRRTIRCDHWQNRLVSRVYSFLVNRILRLGVRDINGLPKIFHRDLLTRLPETMIKTFVFDAQLLMYARLAKWSIEEVPVVFHARHEAMSSWSSQGLETYKNSFQPLMALRKIQRNLSS